MTGRAMPGIINCRISSSPQKEQVTLERLIRQTPIGCSLMRFVVSPPLVGWSALALLRPLLLRTTVSRARTGSDTRATRWPRAAATPGWWSASRRATAVCAGEARVAGLDKLLAWVCAPLGGSSRAGRSDDRRATFYALATVAQNAVRRAAHDRRHWRSSPWHSGAARGAYAQVMGAWG